MRPVRILIAAAMRSSAAAYARSLHTKLDSKLSRKLLMAARLSNWPSADSHMSLSLTSACPC
jgi:hypothetical protein